MCFFEVVKIGLTLLFASDRCCKIQRSWRTEARCTAVVFGSVFVVAAHAPDSGKDLEEHEKFVKDATNIWQEGRRAGAESCHIAGDLNIELELLCIGDDEDQKLHEMYGPQCWPGGEADPRVFSEIDVVQHHEGVELQSCFYLVELWRSTGEGLYTQTLEKHGRTPQLDCIG